MRFTNFGRVCRCRLFESCPHIAKCNFAIKKVVCPFRSKFEVIHDLHCLMSSEGGRVRSRDQLPVQIVVTIDVSAPTEFDQCTLTSGLSHPSHDIGMAEEKRGSVRELLSVAGID